MIYTTLLAAAALISTVTAAPSLDIGKRQSTPSGEGTHNGYFYSYVLSLKEIHLIKD